MLSLHSLKLYLNDSFIRIFGHLIKFVLKYCTNQIQKNKTNHPISSNRNDNSAEIVFHSLAEQILIRVSQNDCSVLKKYSWSLVQTEL